MDGGNSQTSGNTYPAALVAVGAVAAVLMFRREELRQWFADRFQYDPVAEAQRHARKALGIED